MKAQWRLLVALSLLGLGLTATARAESIQPGLGNAWLNTAVAWNEDDGFYFSAGTPQLSQEMGASFKIAGSYARGRGEVNAGFVSFDDPNNTEVSGFSVRYTLTPRDSAVNFSLMAGAQSSRADGSGSKSTAVVSLLAGQKFTRGGGISLGFSFWSDAGTTPAGKDVGEDGEFFANIGVALSRSLKGFVEGWTFGEAERAGYAFGLTAELAPQISLLVGHTFITQPDDDQVTELYFTYKLQ